MRSASVVALGVAAVLAVGGLALAQEPPAAAPAPQPPAVAAPAVATAPELPTIFMPAVRIQVDGKTRYTGNVKMEFKPQNHDAKVISVDVIPKMDAGDIAGDIYKQLTLAAGSDYKVKRSGDRVTIEKANKKVGAPISLKITYQSILGVSFMIDVD